jgi:hypothetical protein
VHTAYRYKNEGSENRDVRNQRVIHIIPVGRSRKEMHLETWNDARQ